MHCGWEEEPGLGLEAVFVVIRKRTGWVSHIAFKWVTLQWVKIESTRIIGYSHCRKQSFGGWKNPRTFCPLYPNSREGVWESDKIASVSAGAVLSYGNSRCNSRLFLFEAITYHLGRSFVYNIFPNTIEPHRKPNKVGKLLLIPL